MTKAFGEGKPAVADVSLRVAAGSFVSLLGPSGCGKTTTLRMIAGLETPDAGEIQVLGKTVFSHSQRIDIPPNRRPIGFVFQSYALWPHMTVFQNLAYPLRRAKADKGTVKKKVAATLGLLRCEQLAGRYPGELSGGQQQRVALGRALVSADNAVILFDEPLSNLDAKLREELRLELRVLQEDLGFTAVYVTHDQSEAMSMSDQVVVMRAGEIERSGDPDSVFHDPRTRYVAQFFGAYNVLDAKASSDQGVPTVETPLGPIGVSCGDRELRPGGHVVIALPVDAVHLETEPTPGRHFTCAIASIAYYGDHSDVRVTIGDLPAPLRCRVPATERFDRGQQVYGRVVGTAVIIEGRP